MGFEVCLSKNVAILESKRSDMSRIPPCSCARNESVDFSDKNDDIPYLKRVRSALSGLLRFPLSGFQFIRLTNRFAAKLYLEPFWGTSEK